MPEPITVTSSLVFLGSAVVNGVLGKESHATFKQNWEDFKQNLRHHKQRPNHDLQRAVYRAYYQAVLQSCAALLERNGVRVDGWFKLGILPERMAEAFRSLLADTPIGVFMQATKQWVEQVSRDQLAKLKRLESQSFVPEVIDDRELASALDEIELLMHPEAAEDAMGKALAERLLADLRGAFGEPPADFTALVIERWFEFFCANFQFYARQRPEVANAFQNTLLAKLAISQEVWQVELAGLGAETLRRIEASQAWLGEEQRKGLAQIESSVVLLLPLLSFARDQAAFNESLHALIRAESDRVIEAVDQTGNRVVADIIDVLDERLVAYELSTVPEPLIQTLPLGQEIEGRDAECDELLRALNAPTSHVLAFAAPGGFGKTALLTKLVQKISPDGRTLVERAMLSKGNTIDPRVGALLHVDGRESVNLAVLFENAGRLVGQRQAFKDLYADTNGTLPQKLCEIFRRLSGDSGKRTWLVFDNFEPLLDENGAVIDCELHKLFGAVFAGGHKVYALIAGRDIPVFSPRERIAELKTIGASLYDGLPLTDCVAYLKKNGAVGGLTGHDAEVESVLAEFATRVHRIPLALVWAVGYVADTGYTLKEVLTRRELFTDFDRGQGKESKDYRYKGLKRLHYEQLQRQPKERVPVLGLLAFFKRPVPKGALAHLLDEIKLNRTLTRLERSKLVTHTQSANGYARFVNDPLEVNLYGLHPVVCENEFFAVFADKETLYETTARQCRSLAASAFNVRRFSYALELFSCAEALYEQLLCVLDRTSLLRNYVTVMVNKNLALQNLHRLEEAVVDCDKAIAVLDQLVNAEQQTHLAYDLAMIYMNRGNALQSLERLGQAVAEYDKTLGMLERLVNVEQQRQLANYLAVAYINRGQTLCTLQRFKEAVADCGKAVTILERLVNVEQQRQLANYLATAYMGRGNALLNSQRLSRAVTEYDKAIAIREQLVNVEQQAHLADDLAMSYMNRGNALDKLKRPEESVAEYDKAIAIRGRLVNVEQQTHLANNLAAAYANKGNALINLQRPEVALAEYDKAIAIREQLVNVEQQAHLAAELAATYGNKGNALLTLDRYKEAMSEYEKAIVILERVVNIEQQTHFANDLARSYANRGNALDKLKRPEEAVAEYDKAIPILEPLVDVEQQTHLAYDLAAVYSNKALTLETQKDWLAALDGYKEAVRLQLLCVEKLSMFWITPELLGTLHSRLKILLDLRCWSDAALDVLAVIDLASTFLQSPEIPRELQQATVEERSQTILRLRALSDSERRLLFAELGDAAEVVSSLVSDMACDA
jgi:tetratricopeptide (TPR) repeat protein